MENKTLENVRCICNIYTTSVMQHPQSYLPAVNPATIFFVKILKRGFCHNINNLYSPVKTIF
jgi:hypothetical protein